MKKYLYIVRKYVYADSIQDALKKEKKQQADDVWMDEEHRRKQITQKVLPTESSGSSVGFKIK